MTRPNKKLQNNNKIKCKYLCQICLKSNQNIVNTMNNF